MDYGIAVRNKFELFLDDEDADPLEILRLQEEENLKEKVVKGKDGKSQKDNKSAKNKKNNKAQSTVQEKSKPVEAKDAKKDDKPLRNKSRNDDRPNRPLRENRERDLPPRRQQQQQDGGRPMSSGSGGFGQQTSPTGGDQFRERGEGGRGRGRGRGGRGGGRGRGGFDRFGKREFERHSGSDKTGIKATEKREGAGAHNWGTPKDDVEDELNKTAPTEGTPEWTAPSEDVENVQPDAAPEATDDAPQEEDPSASEMTLDEWKALQTKERQAKSFNVRKPGEGCDNKQWKQTYVLKKKANEEEDDESDEEEEDDEIDHRKKNLVNIEITFGDSRRGGGGGRGSRGGRGGRGGGGGMDRRGRGGRGSGGAGPSTGRGGRREQAPNVEDEQDFPSLMKPAA